MMKQVDKQDGQMNKMDDLLYESGLTAQGCWDELDNYTKECIMKFGRMIVNETMNILGSQMDKHGVDLSNLPTWYKCMEKTEEYFGINQ